MHQTTSAQIEAVREALKDRSMDLRSFETDLTRAVTRANDQIAERARVARSKAATLNPAEQAAMDAVKALDALQSQHANTGASDTEPDGMKQLCFRRALICGEAAIPTTGRAWQLYSPDPASRRDEPRYLAPEVVRRAVRASTSAAKRADRLIRALPRASRKRLSLRIDLWRVQDIDWDWM